ncbi:MAG TPA: glycosyltransferase [Rudaea sp.]
MRVLITNNTLAGRGGTEMYVRDVALALLRRGHHVVAYSSRLGEVAQVLRDATVPVVDDLDRIGASPDVIHGQHHLDAMSAMLRFPQVPAVYFCHGWVPWEEMPPRFPSLRRYVAVDDLCAERLCCEEGITPELVDIIRNFVDLKRFRLRSNIAKKPTRALVFGNNARADGYAAVVQRACERRGIQVDVVGAGAGRVATHPEEILSSYDLVFAKARSAMEAMATGAAVVVCDAAGSAGLVTSENYEHWRALNFGIRTLSQPITTENVLAAIDAYDADQVRTLAGRLRSDADMEPAVDAIIKTYQRAIDSMAPASVEQVGVSTSRYLRRIAVEVKLRHEALSDRAVAFAERETDRARAVQAEKEVDQIVAEAVQRTHLARDEQLHAILAEMATCMRRCLAWRRAFAQTAIPQLESDRWAALAPVLARLSIDRLVEIACGRCGWLAERDTGDLHYVGVDMIEDIIARNRVDRIGPNWTFEVVDPVVQELPSADAALCFDWLEWLPIPHIGATLHRVITAKTKYLIAGTDESVEVNPTTTTGERRAVNLMRAPFNLPEPIEYIGVDGLRLGVWQLRP